MKSIIFLLFLIVFCELKGQNNCNETEFLISDFQSENILILGSKDSLLKKMGEPLKIVTDSNYLVIDSISNINRIYKRYYSYIAIEYLFFDGLQYICYNDSVQLLFIDFTIANNSLLLNNLILNRNLELDTLLEKFGIDNSCVNITFNVYYISHKKVYQVAFNSRKFAPSGFGFFFDYSLKKLWYIEFGANKTGGIIH